MQNRVGWLLFPTHTQKEKSSPAMQDHIVILYGKKFLWIGGNNFYGSAWVVAKTIVLCVVLESLCYIRVYYKCFCGIYQNCTDRILEDSG